MRDPNENSNHRLLVIDDNPAIHEDFRKIFSPPSAAQNDLQEAEATLFGAVEPGWGRPQFTLDSAQQGAEGLALVQRAKLENRPYAVAFVDMRMPPGWDGVETIARLWEEAPDLQAVICTAYSDYTLDDILKELGNSDRLVILKKPFDSIEVLQLAHALTAKWQLLQRAMMKAGELERSVAERTQELQAANKKLKAEIAERIRVEEAFRQSQKMEAVGQLAGGVAHDFNNILTVIRGYTCMVLADERLDGRTQDLLKQVDDAAQRASNLTRQLLTFSRKQIMQLEHLNLSEVVGQVAKMLHRVLGEDIALKIQTAENLPTLHADRSMMEQVVLNLAVNARDAMPGGGQLQIEVDAVEFNDSCQRQNPDCRAGRFLKLTVTDSGCGIAPEIMPRLFEPFFTTKAVGKGTGLGLATVYGVVKQHQGWIEVTSEPGRGASFRIFLPESVRAEKLRAETQFITRPLGGNETIFLVEDEPALCVMTAKILRSYGYQVITAASGVEALKLWPAHAAKIELLLTDMVMPDGVSGGELAKELQGLKASLKVIYSSGYSHELVGRDATLSEGLNFLPKPYTPEKLARLVRKCLDATSPDSMLTARLPSSTETPV